MVTRDLDSEIKDKQGLLVRLKRIGDEEPPEVSVNCEAEWHGAHVYPSPAVLLLFKHVLRGVFEKMIQVAFQE